MNIDKIKNIITAYRENNLKGYVLKEIQSMDDIPSAKDFITAYRKGIIDQGDAAISSKILREMGLIIEEHVKELELLMRQRERGITPKKMQLINKPRKK